VCGKMFDEIIREFGVIYLKKRVVVTGVAAITPIGNTADEFWKNLIAGKSGVSRIT